MAPSWINRTRSFSSSSYSTRQHNSSLQLNLTFVLEPNNKSVKPSDDALQYVASELDPRAKFTNDTKSKNFWIHVSSNQVKTVRSKADQLAIVGAFSVRHPKEAEIIRIEKYISNMHASVLAKPTSGPLTAAVPGPSRHKRAAVDASLDPIDHPEAQTTSENQEPRKRARVPTRNNTGDSQHDHATAIQDLPESCIRLIIIYATPNPLLAPGKTYRKRLYDLIRVCVEWKSVIEKTPTLWSHLTSSNPPAMLDACVRRSLGIPVTVRFDGLLHPPITVSAELDRFIDKIAARRGDWKSVQFINLPPTSSSISSINRALAGSKPRLTSSEATTIYKTPVSGLDGRLCFSDAPRLRDITIAGFTLDPSNVTGAFHSLQRLQLHGPMYLTSSFLLFQLSKNKSLRYLELEDIQIISSQSLYHLDTLELPELRQLNLSLLASQTTEVIEVFNRLRAPKLRRMKLSIDMDDLTQLALTSNHLQSCTESFLVQLGNRLSGLMILDDFRTRSAYRWLHPAQANVFDKSILHWVAKGSPDGQYSSALLDTRLHTNSSDTKRLISDWAEDVKTYEEEALVRASLLEGLHDMDRMVSFRAYRIQVLEDRKGN